MAYGVQLMNSDEVMNYFGNLNIKKIKWLNDYTSKIFILDILIKLKLKLKIYY